LAVYKPKIRLTAVSERFVPFTIFATVKPVSYKKNSYCLEKSLFFSCFIVYSIVYYKYKTKCNIVNIKNITKHDIVSTKYNTIFNTSRYRYTFVAGRKKQENLK